MAIAADAQGVGSGELPRIARTRLLHIDPVARTKRQLIGQLPTTLTRHSDRFALPADRRELGRGGRLDGGDYAERSLEQGPSDRAEASAETKRSLGDTG